MKAIASTLTAAALLGMATPTDAAVLGTFEFTGGSLVATDADPLDGVTISDLNLNSYAASVVDAPNNNLQLDGVETANGTSSAFSGDLYMSFTVTNNSGSTINFENISADLTGNNIFQQMSARVFTTNAPGSVVDDTISRLRVEGGNTALFTDVALLDGTDPVAGANTVGIPTTLADSSSVTFYLPWNMNSNSTSRFITVDNLSISGVIPEPGSMVLMALGGLAMLRRRG